MGWTVYNSDGKILQSAELGDNAVTSAKIADGAIVNADINASAAVAYSKLAALADGNILVGNGSNVATSVNPSGDVDISNTGAFSIASGAVVNADVNASAAIAFSKMANLTTARALVSDGSGDVSVSAVTSTEIGYLDGVTSAIQTQLDAAGGAVTRDGGDSTETTTTSTSSADLLTQASMTINALSPLGIVFVTRKTSGASVRTQGGFDLNGTDYHMRNTAGTENQIENGNVLYWLPPRVTSYLRAGASSIYTSLNTSGGSRFTDVNSGTQTADFPTGNVTDITVHGKTDSASQTMGCDELHIHSKSSS